MVKMTGFHRFPPDVGASCVAKSSSQRRFNGSSRTPKRPQGDKPPRHRIVSVGATRTSQECQPDKLRRPPSTQFSRSQSGSRGTLVPTGSGRRPHRVPLAHSSGAPRLGSRRALRVAYVRVVPWRSLTVRSRIRCAQPRRDEGPSWSPFSGPNRCYLEKAGPKSPVDAHALAILLISIEISVDPRREWPEER